MASTDFDYISTRNEIIERALRIVGALELGEPMSAEQVAQGSQALNEMVKAWETERVFLWTLKNLSFSTVAGTASYAGSALDTSNSSIIGIDAAYYYNGSTEEDLEVISWVEYQKIIDKAVQDIPRLVAVLPNANTITAYFWPTPAAIYTIKLSAVCRLKDFDSSSSTGDFPSRFTRALVYGLAYDLSDEYSLPVGEKDRIGVKANEALRKAKSSDLDREDDNCVKGAYSYR